ncbi:MAG TPA: hypothetical protein VE983_08580, partial [Solirubrobacteraceae bacterium]|nr:hypothetical protein [Solirubrobacteraceae bacterium]
MSTFAAGAQPASAHQTSYVKACTAGCSPDAPTISSFTAGGNTSLFWNITLDTGLRPASTSTVEFPPGLFFLLAADRSCLVSNQHTSACDLGGYPAAYTGPPNATIPLTEYLVPATTAGNLAGIDYVDTQSSVTDAHAEIKVRQLTTGPAIGQLVTDVLMALPTTPVDFRDTLKALDTAADGTLPNGMPFTRMPTGCTPGRSSLTVAYATQTVTTYAAPDIDVSSTCASLPYAPEIYGRAKVTGRLSAGAYSARFTGGERQKNGEASSRRETIVMPSDLRPNRTAFARDLGKQVGSAAATSPVVPGILRARVFLTGSSSTPELTLRFQKPFAFALNATLHASSNTLVFSHMPDLPTLALHLTL